MRGKFITFEGGEGVGKSTQARLLYEKLTEMKLKVRITREPGGDEVGEKIRDVLKSSSSTKIDPLCETLLLFAARRDHYIKLISPFLEQGYIVICDRFYDSSLVYQGLLKKVPFEDIMTLKCMTIGDLEPDLTFILDMNADISMQRLVVRNLIHDEYDSMAKEKHNIIRDGFKKIADIFSFRTALINADGTEKTVFSRIMKIIKQRLHFYSAF
jgi:dTMP kinase